MGGVSDITHIINDMAKKLKKNAKNIGGTVLPTGVDLDPHNDLTLVEDGRKKR